MSRSPVAELTARDVYFFSEVWSLLYLAGSVVVSIVLLLVVFFPAGLSVRSDAVFGLLALLSVLTVDVFARTKLRRRMVISARLPYSILYVMVPLCIYVMLARPFEA